MNKQNKTIETKALLSLSLHIFITAHHASDFHDQSNYDRKGEAANALEPDIEHTAREADLPHDNKTI